MPKEKKEVAIEEPVEITKDQRQKLITDKIDAMLQSDNQKVVMMAVNLLHKLYPNQLRKLFALWFEDKMEASKLKFTPNPQQIKLLNDIEEQRRRNRQAKTG